MNRLAMATKQQKTWAWNISKHILCISGSEPAYMKKKHYKAIRGWQVDWPSTKKTRYNPCGSTTGWKVRVGQVGFDIFGGGHMLCGYAGPSVKRGVGFSMLHVILQTTLGENYVSYQWLSVVNSWVFTNSQLRDIQRRWLCVIHMLWSWDLHPNEGLFLKMVETTKVKMFSSLEKHSKKQHLQKSWNNL